MDVDAAVDSSSSECGIECLQLSMISLQRLKSHMHDNRHSSSLLSFMFLAVCKDDIDSSKFQLKCARLVNN